MNQHTQPGKHFFMAFLVKLLAFSTLLLTPFVASAAVPGCSADVTLSTEGAATGFDPLDYDVNMVGYGDAATGAYEGSLYLEMGQQSIDQNVFKIPFEQEICVSFLYDDNSGELPALGWINLNDAVYDNQENFNWDATIDVDNPANYNPADHVIFSQIADVDNDGSLDSGSSRQCLGTFNADTEIVFWLANNNGDLNDNNTDVLFSKMSWNPDTFEQVILAATDSPNRVESRWEKSLGGGDMDYNDIAFTLEREHGGSVAMKPKRPSDLDPNVAENAFYTGVTFKVFDAIPASTGSCRIDYYVNVDDGEPLLITDADWDLVRQYALNADGTKTPVGDPLVGWFPGSVAFTYREARIDFVGVNRTGRDLVWRAALRSDDVNCIPRIMGVEIDASTASPQVDIARSSPVMVGNVLYSGSFRPPDVGANDMRPRGRLRASEIYDPYDPSVANDPPVPLWEAGAVLNATAAGARNIYFPDVTAETFADSLILSLPDGTTTADRGDGATLTYTGTLPGVPVLATTVRIFAGAMEFRDEGLGNLTSAFGGGRINLFTGQFTLTFDSDHVPAITDSFRAEYTYYSSPATGDMKILSNSNVRVTNALLGLDDRQINGTDYIYDFDGLNGFTVADREFLVDWGRGSGRDWKLGAIDHSVPAVLVPPSKPNWYYGTSTSAATRVSYNTFLNAHANRQAALFVGSRSGMLHAFDAGRFLWGDNPATSLPLKERRGYFTWYDHDGDANTPDIRYGTGKELWAFVPANLLPRLKNNYMNEFSQEGDQAFVDASPTLTDIRMDTDCPGCLPSDCASGELVGAVGFEQCVGEWRTILLSAQGNGGDSVFCLDVTDPLIPKFLWEYADPELFRSRSSPAVGKIGRIQVDGAERWAAFFVSGRSYDANLFPSIYIIDIVDGSLIERIFLDAVAADPDTSPSGRGGVPSGQPAIVDTDGNGYIDRLYIGTDKGLLYKVNLPDAPAAFLSDINNVIINEDFYADALAATINDQDNPVPLDQQWHPIYASPTVTVEHKVNADGSIAYETRLFFGTGDNPYYDEGINTAETTYHFFAYVDRAPKGSIDHTQVELDWFFPLDATQRVFASAFVAAGKVYFGTSTSDTEDPCGGLNQGELYVFDLSGYDAENPVQPSTRIVTGDITTTPLVEDEHLFIRTKKGTLMVGGGGFNNETKVRGFGVTRPMTWRELTD